MAGRATAVEITYKCDDCEQRFTVYQDVDASAYQLVLDTLEEHEDCEHGR